jgi:predicted Zn-dependent protease with MMP-like domain
MNNKWSDLRAPDLEDFEALAKSAYGSLPAEFRELTQGVGFVVADFPEDDVLDSLGLESEFDLLGLFHGVGRNLFGDSPPTGMMPNRIWLYRRPILDYWSHHQDETLGQIVTHVLVHEIGHHFGFSDADMQAIEDAARTEGD